MYGALSAICVGCTNKKLAPAHSFLAQATLAEGAQDTVANEWSARLQRNPGGSLLPAAKLYVGQGVVRARTLAAELDTSLFVISAGLGLLRGSTLVPAYDLTIAKVPGAVTERIAGSFSPEAWWDSVLRGPYSVPTSTLAHGRGRIVIALSRSYAAMVGPWLATLPMAVQARLRILGAGLDRDLPSSLTPQWIRYDDRLDALVPGIKLHYSTRAMEHFLSVCGRTPMVAVSADQARVDVALRQVHATRPERRIRPKLDDETLAPMVAQAMARCGSMARALHHLRKVAGVACSDQRFRFLLHEARA